jgi:hypothetical protein
MKKLILALLLFSVNIRAQSTITNEHEIEIQFNVYLDGKQIETDSVQIGTISGNKMPNLFTISNNFTTYFKPNRLYHIVVTHPKYDKQVLRLKTDSSQMKSGGHLDIYLRKGTDICYIGELRYNKLLKRYIVN